MIAGRCSKTVAFVATLALTTFGALTTASDPSAPSRAPIVERSLKKAAADSVKFASVQPVGASIPPPVAAADATSALKPPVIPFLQRLLGGGLPDGSMIQIGAFPTEQAAKERLSMVQSKASKMLTGAVAFTTTIEKGGTTYYRAQFAGLDKDQAETACGYLKEIRVRYLEPGADRTRPPAGPT